MPAVSAPQVDWEAYIDAVAPVTGLHIRDDWKPAVAMYLAMAANAAALFASLPLDDAADEAAPVFRAGDEP